MREKIERSLKDMGWNYFSLHLSDLLHCPCHTVCLFVSSARLIGHNLISPEQNISFFFPLTHRLLFLQTSLEL